MALERPCGGEMVCAGCGAKFGEYHQGWLNAERCEYCGKRPDEQPAYRVKLAEFGLPLDAQ